VDIKKLNFLKLQQIDFMSQYDKQSLNIEWFRAIYDDTVVNKNWHSHSGIEIHFVLEGSLLFHFEDRTIKVKEKQAILIPPNYNHQLENIEHDNYFRLILNISFDSLNMNSETEFLYSALSIEKPVCLPIYEYVENLLKSCLDEASEQISGFITIIKSSVQMILISFARELTQSRKAIYYINEKRCFDEQRIQHIVNFVDQSSTGALLIKDIAHYMHLSEKQVQRIIKSQLGISAKQLIMNTRLKKAKQLLKDPDLSIAMVSNRLEFANESCFFRFFKSMEGQTPMKYRNGVLSND
jgi:AraC-like DNA-binding protein